MAALDITLILAGQSLVLTSANLIEEGKVLRRRKYEQTIDRTADGNRRYEGPFHPNPYLYEIEARLLQSQVETLEMFYSGWEHIIAKQGANTIQPGNSNPALILRDERNTIKAISVLPSRPVCPGYSATPYLFGVRYYPELRVDFASEPQVVDLPVGQSSATGECVYSVSFSLEEQDLA